MITKEDIIMGLQKTKNNVLGLMFFFGDKNKKPLQLGMGFFWRMAPKQKS